ncbi:MAG: hypothetical protein D6780_04560, partial [Candidatus Dadabacteria bacterium]
GAGGSRKAIILTVNNKLRRGYVMNKKSWIGILVLALSLFGILIIPVITLAQNNVSQGANRFNFHPNSVNNEHSGTLPDEVAEAISVIRENGDNAEVTTESGKYTVYGNGDGSYVIEENEGVVPIPDTDEGIEYAAQQCGLEEGAGPIVGVGIIIKCLIDLFTGTVTVSFVCTGSDGGPRYPSNVNQCGLCTGGTNNSQCVACCRSFALSARRKSQCCTVQCGVEC